MLSSRYYQGLFLPSASEPLLKCHLIKSLYMAVFSKRTPSLPLYDSPVDLVADLWLDVRGGGFVTRHRPECACMWARTAGWSGWVPERRTSVIVSFVSVCRTRAAKNVKNTSMSFRNTQVQILTLSLCCLVTKHVWLFCNPMDSCPPGSSVQGISQARILECRFLPQGIFLTQILNPHLLHGR